MNIAEEIINQIRERINIVDAIGEYVPLKPSGQNYKGLCPFHTEKTPSFMVSPQKGIFHCFGCGIGGNIFNFLMKFKGVSFPEAVKFFGDRVGISVSWGIEKSPDKGKTEYYYDVNKRAAHFFQKNLFSSSGRFALEYLEKRGIDQKIIKTFFLGYSLNSWDGLLREFTSQGYTTNDLESVGLIVKNSKESGYYDRFRNRIVFPIQDGMGRFIGFGGRTLVDDENLPKYINTNENLLYHKGKYLYAFPIAQEHIRKKDSVFLVEGYIDVIRMHKEGFNNTVAPLGTALTEDQIGLILRYTRRIYMVFDPDQAGLNATLRSVSLLHRKGVDPCSLRLPAGNDPGNFFDKYSYSDFEILVSEALSGIDFIIKNFIENKKEYTANEKIIILKSLVEYLNNLNDPILREELIKKISEGLKTDEYILRREIERLTQSTKIVEKKPSTYKKKSDISTELHLLLLILNNPELFYIAESRLDDSHFHGRWTKKLWKAIIEACKIKNWDSAIVFEYLDDEKFVDYLSGKLIDDTWNVNPKEQIVDVVSILSEKKIRSLIALINQKLEKAELESDGDLQNELIVEKQAFVNELEKLKTLRRSKMLI